MKNYLSRSTHSRANLTRQQLRQRDRARRLYFSAVLVLAFCAALTVPAFAAGGSDPLTIVNNLSDFIFSIIKALGIIILGWGIVQVGMSFQSHDASQRTQGFLCLFGGLMIAFAKEILSVIGVV
ncbi:TrbC/VirB2 family protein [uncultured Oscillibacter sp.]|uniref:TrbC/VirB2 family protein n=1 Tax=uncultured Oscillibacter sp. TaxID=876091 RepID=UPI002615EE96|nr:TrbC/VirB2 family protein [uncultured Oscillibacter sp.]